MEVRCSCARKALRALCVLLLALTVCGKAWATAVGLVRVTTPSVESGYYSTKLLSGAALARGALVCVDAASPAAPAALRASALSENVLMKRVAATRGDVVDYDGEHVTVNGRALPSSRRLATDSQGRALPFPRFPVVLAADEVWLASDNARGFDSRYFGPVSRAALTCEAELLWRR